MTDALYFKQTDSTNKLLKELLKERELPEATVVYTNFQSDGKGQPGNSWESEAGKNLLCSILLYPDTIAINKQFVISQICCLAIKKVLDTYTDGISIKWSNDIYWRDKKMGGILIENSLFRDKIRSSIMGIGLNVNQEQFRSDAPNPVSLKQVIGKETDCEKLLTQIHSELMKLYRAMDYGAIRQQYHESLYRKEGFHRYTDCETKEQFMAKIEAVAPDGRLILITDKDEKREYYFKELSFNLPGK